MGLRMKTMTQDPNGRHANRSIAARMRRPTARRRRIGALVVALAAVAVLGAALGSGPVEVAQASTTACPDTVYLGNYPSGSSLGWNGDSQGVAHDDGDWFFTTQDWLLKIPVQYNLATPFNPAHPPAGVETRGPNPLSSYGYDHLGDLDQVGGFLFVPVENSSKKRPPAIAVFKASDLSFVGLKVTAQANAGWVAFNARQDLLYSSDNDVSGTDPLYRYKVDFSKLATGDVGDGITYQDRFHLLEANGTQLSPPLGNWMQGGVFTPRGDLYVVNGNGDDFSFAVRGGIHLFGTNGRLIAESTNDSGKGAFDFAYSPGLDDQEPEGIDWWNRDVGPASPGITGQLHVMLNDNNTFTADKLFFKHYEVNYSCEPITGSGNGPGGTGAR